MPDSFRLRPSRSLSLVLISVYAVAIASVLMLPVALLARSMLAMLLACALLFYLCRDAWLLLPESTVALQLNNAEATLLSRAGGDCAGRILTGSVVMPAITILNVLPAGRKIARSVVIFPDSMDSERFRELRVLLKWKHGKK